MRGQTAATRKPLRSTSKVGESLPSSYSNREKILRNGPCPKQNRSKQNFEQARRNNSKKNNSTYVGPYVEWIHSTIPNPKLKIPPFVLYSGQSRAQEHICRYKTSMGLVTTNKAVLCKAFPSTLSNRTLTWFTLLKQGTIDSWKLLKKSFMDKFNTAGIIPKTRGDLANVKQRDDEILLEYLKRFRRYMTRLMQLLRIQLSHALRTASGRRCCTLNFNSASQKL